jgi:hypothetical protein
MRASTTDSLQDSVRSYTVARSTGSSTLNPCSYCHLVHWPDATILSGAPANYQDTLNPYGLAYKTAGRSQDALRTIEGQDSDVDTYSSVVEIQNLRYPGDPASVPGQPWVPTYTMTWDALHAPASHTQFLLMNASKQTFDDYANYRGIKIVDLLTAAGVNLAAATGITVIAPDGFMKDFTLAQVQTQFADGIFDSGLAPADFADPNQGFVNCPAANQIPSGLADLGTIPDAQWLLLACWRDGGDVVPSELDPASGKINGEGPYRLVQPQVTPGTPDRGSTAAPWGDGYDYDNAKDHTTPATASAASWPSASIPCRPATRSSTGRTAVGLWWSGRKSSCTEREWRGIEPKSARTRPVRRGPPGHGARGRGHRPVCF